MESDYLLIGIDGGATKVNGWSIHHSDDDRTFELGEIQAACSYAEIAGYDDHFQPVNLNLQLEEMRQGCIRPTEAEIRQGVCYKRACAGVIETIARASGAERIIAGIGMPGIKTADQRGIAAMANGPRMIDYAADIESYLDAQGVRLLRPISHIGSDAYYCGLGEEYARDGQFRDIANAYYLGGGTGAADALKLNRQVVSLDEIKHWFVKAWELQSDTGLSLEKYVSSKGIQELYAGFSGQTLVSLNDAGIFPPQICERARQTDDAAAETFKQVAYYLARLLFERIVTLFAGWSGLFGFINPNRVAPEAAHPFRGTLFDRLIIGQRLGDLVRNSISIDVLWNPMIAHLSAWIADCPALSPVAKAHYLEPPLGIAGRISISNLREAPALGAGIDACLSIKR